METTTLNVTGMTCGNCVKSVENGIGNLAGVKSVKVTLDTGTVDIKFDASVVSLAQIKKEIENLGYNVA